MVGFHRQAFAHAYANAARAFRHRPSRHHIVDGRIGGIDRRYHPELVRVLVVDLERVARVVLVGAERRDHDRAVDADTGHGSDHFLARGGVQPVGRTGPRPAGMIPIEGMDLNVDDWHGISSCSFGLSTMDVPYSTTVQCGRDAPICLAGEAGDEERACHEMRDAR